MASLAESRLGQLVLHLKEENQTGTFVESGTYTGETTRWAARHFDHVHSIELSEILYQQAQSNLRGLTNVSLVQGDSGRRLQEVVKQIRSPAIFWLDGHYSFGGTAGEEQECPVLGELAALAGRKEDVILIDDAHMFLRPPPPPHRAEDWPLLPRIFDELRRIDPEYFIVVHENAVIAVPQQLRAIVQTHLAESPAETPAPSNSPSQFPKPLEKTLLEKTLKARGIWDGASPLRLHLGCGEQHFDGYVNIDYPSAQHNVMQATADYAADIQELSCSDAVVDEIRLHHVFEHFNRSLALNLLIRWHQWLKMGGRLHIETPDLMGCAKTLLSDAHPRTKAAVVRHLVGDQSAQWAYHVDQWYEDRFRRSLTKLGYSVVQMRPVQWPHEPFLSNIEIIATKTEARTLDQQLLAAEELLWDATVADAERPTFEVWRKQLYGLFGLEPTTAFNPPGGARENTIAQWRALPTQTIAIPDDFNARLGQRASRLPLWEIHNFNQLSRDQWVKEQAAKIPAGSTVLDVGAGTCLYRPLFSHCSYTAQDFQGYDGFRDNREGKYGAIDITSDIIAIPVPDASFDTVICTEVLEHVPEPILAVKEMVRILKPGGRLLLSAPLGSGLHQLPFHFYGGFTPEWYKKFLTEFGCEIDSITPNGGFFKLLAQECARVAWTRDQHQGFHGEDHELVCQLFGDLLPRYLYAMDESLHYPQFTVGYHVAATKSASMQRHIDSAPIKPLSSTKQPNGEILPALHGGRKAEAGNTRNVVAIVFSKDRPLQLDATLASLALHCKDIEQIPVYVLVKATTPAASQGYQEISRLHPRAKLVEERSFKSELIALSANSDHILFLVDDNLFCRSFSIADALDALTSNPETIGFSLRLGGNTSYCYALDRNQNIPAMTRVAANIRKFQWTGAEFDFGYPLEVSSSIYRTKDIAPLLESLPYDSPNSFESALAQTAGLYASSNGALLCYDMSVAFCAPLNKVQNFNDNRAGRNDQYSPERLLALFNDGYRVEVESYRDFVPQSCHQEITLRFKTNPNPPSDPTVSVVIPCYNQGEYLTDAVTSLVEQSYTDWECIIVNDGSTDQTNAVAAQLMARFQNYPFRLIEQPNAGLSSARNTGIKAARGKYILPLDADDKLHSDYLKLTVNILDTNEDVSIVYVDEDNFGIKSGVHVKGDSNLASLLRFNVHDYCSLYRKTVWGAVGGYSSAMYLGGEDWNFWLSAAKRGFKSRHLSAPLFLYRNRENTMVAETLANLEEVWSHIVLHHPEMYGEPERDRAKEIIRRMPQAHREKIVSIRQKVGGNRLLDLFLALADGGDPTAESGTASPLVSVILPTYERPQFLLRALDCLRSQTYKQFEVVVVNDHGVDVKDIVDRFSRQLDITYFRHEANRGLAAARNTALNIARGEIVVYLDDDDVFLPHHIETAVAALQSGNAEFIYTDAEYVIEKEDNGNWTEINRYNPFAGITYSRERLHIQNFIPVNAWAHRIGCLEAIGYFDESLKVFEDWDFLIRIGRRYDIAHIPRTTVEVHSRDSGDNMLTRERHLFTETYRLIYARYDDLGSPVIAQGRRQMLEPPADTAKQASSAPAVNHDTGTDFYQQWLQRHRPDYAWPTSPEAVISCRFILFGRAGQNLLLADTIDSLAALSYPAWNLSVIAETVAPNPLFDELENLHWLKLEDFRSCHHTVNDLARQEPSEWLIFVPCGALLNEQLLLALSGYSAQFPDCRLFYTDSDTREGTGKLVNPRLRPDFNLDLLRSTHYMDDCLCIRRDAFLEVDGFTDAGPACLYDLVFKIVDRYGENAIGHIDEILYHVPADTAPRQEEPAKQALLRHLQRNDITALVSDGYQPGSFRVTYLHALSPKVSIIVSTKDQAGLLRECIGSIVSKTSYPDYEIIIVDHQSRQRETLDYLAELQQQHADKIRVLNYSRPFNHSAMRNLAANTAAGEYLLFLDNDTQVMQKEWLHLLMGHGQRPEVGVVAPKLAYPGSAKIQHAGVVMGMGGVADHPYMGLIGLTESGYMDRAQLDQELSAVSGACLLVRKAVFDQVGGMDEATLRVNHSAIDLCLKVRQQGYKVVWTPYTTLIHHGGATQREESKNAAKAKEAKERLEIEYYAMLEKWQPQIARDPSYNRHLSLLHRDYRVDQDFIVNWDPRLPSERTRILGWTLDGAPCDYRLKIPLRALAEAGAVETGYIYPPGHGLIRSLLPSEIARARPDIFTSSVFLGMQDHLQTLKQIKQTLRVPIVMQLDDFVTEVPKGSHAYEQRNKPGDLKKLLGMADRVVASTQPIADFIGKMCEDIHLVPNYLPISLWDGLASTRRQGAKPRVGWAGAMQHGGDLALITEVVQATAREVDWVFFGMCPDSLGPFVREFHPFVPFHEYPAKLASLNLDLAIAPLEENKFNEGKSNLRLLEYGFMGWPVVCSDVVPYRGAPVKRVANKPQAWVEAIRERVSDPDSAEREGDALRQWVLDHWILEHHLDQWARAYSFGL